jgi:hypothetical protein
LRGRGYDGAHDSVHLKTAVEAIFIGKERQNNHRFLHMCSHHLIEPVACSPASYARSGHPEQRPPAFHGSRHKTPSASAGVRIWARST